ncbi:MAG: hypothetical protein HY318_02520, partial [Armatimonadetes bacterium]|nr:hypothetical protein [Armatimonadota bacterium]
MAIAEPSGVDAGRGLPARLLAPELRTSSPRDGHRAPLLAEDGGGDRGVAKARSRKRKGGFGPRETRRLGGGDLIQDPDMHSTGLKVLSLGFTRDLWEDEDGVQGDTLNRLIANSRHLSYYAVVTHSFRKHRLVTPRKINETFWTYATNAVTPIDAWWRMFRLGSRMGRQHSLDLIQTQDPFLTGSVGHCLSRQLGVPLNVCVYGSNPFDVHWRRGSWINRLGAPWARAILRSAAGIQADGTATIQSLVTNGIPEERIAYKPVVPNNLSQFFSAKRDESLRKELSADRRFDHLALFVGRFVPQKNLR